VCLLIDIRLAKHRTTRNKSDRKFIMKSFCLILLLASTPLIAQTCDIMSTLKELDATTQRIDSESKAEFEKRVSEYAKLSGMNEQATLRYKIEVVMSPEILALQRNVKDDMSGFMEAFTQKDCDEIKRIAGVNHERAKKQWAISIKIVEDDIAKYQ
jgi:hypothetical protein